uniref:Ferritin n=1 Tax=Biomphalaria glabrata TaxID=6526 RepID=A0A2C9M2D9_BIOGL
MILYILVMFTLIGSSSQQDLGFVRHVSQNFHEKINSKLEQQILSFHNQELALRAYASYFGRADVNLLGFKKLLTGLRDRALDNALSVTTFINDRGGRVRFPVVQLKDACNEITKSLTSYDILHPSFAASGRTQPHICNFLTTSAVSKKRNPADDNDNSDDDTRDNWRAGLYALEDTLALEKSINNGLINLAKEATKFSDPQTRDHVENFIDKQVEVIQKLAEIITKLRRYQQDDEYNLGEYLINNELES